MDAFSNYGLALVYLVKSVVNVQSVPPLKDNQSGDFVFSEVDKANVLDKYFAGCQQPCLTHCCSCNSPISPVPPVTPVSPAATSATISADDILSTLRQIDARKSNGPFLLTHELLRRCGTSLVLPLLILFKSILETGSFPSSWKRSFITAIPKGSTDRSLLANWCPISLLPPISKLFEAIINIKIRSYLETNFLLSTEQFGFRSKHSTELLLSLFLQDVADDMARGREVDCVFLDCEKAFDRADHAAILDSLQAVGVETSVVNLISDYLTDRTQVTMVDGVPSDEQHVTSGVPQGSILGPLLYIVMVNSVGSVLQSTRTHLKLFADDIVLYRTVCDTADEKQFQLDLDEVTVWASAHKLTFNSLKSVHVRFKARKTEQPSPSYLLRLVLFRSLVLPLFDYCAAVVHPQLKTLNDALEKTVHAFLRTVNLGVPPDASPDEKYSLLLMQLGMEPLVIRRLKSALSMAYKLIIGRIPFASYFFESFVPVASAALVAGNTRTAHQRLQHPRPVQVVKRNDAMSQSNALVPHGSASSFAARTGGPAEGTFSYIAQKVWNDLPFPESAYAPLTTFQAALEHLDWRSLPSVARVLSESCCSYRRKDTNVSNYCSFFEIVLFSLLWLLIVC